MHAILSDPFSETKGRGSPGKVVAFSLCLCVSVREGSQWFEMVLSDAQDTEDGPYTRNYFLIFC